MTKNLKTKNKAAEKEFDRVKTFRKIKKGILKGLLGKSTKEILDYLQINSLKFQTGK